MLGPSWSQGDYHAGGRSRRCCLCLEEPQTWPEAPVTIPRPGLPEKGLNSSPTVGNPSRHLQGWSKLGLALYTGPGKRRQTSRDWYHHKCLPGWAWLRWPAVARPGNRARPSLFHGRNLVRGRTLGAICSKWVPRCPGVMLEQQ